MVDYIMGINGIGKTRILAEAAVCTAMSSKGNVVYVDSSDKLALELPSSIRLINTQDYEILGASSLYGFLIGLCVSDYDLTDVFIDSTLDIISNSNTNINDLMEIVSKLSETTGVNFHFSVCDEYERELLCYIV
ncbi:MAG: twitching motility protein PilT [Clostridiales bacterium]|nr:twitching motility protein PilT [Clostridiales bacterium]